MTIEEFIKASLSASPQTPADDRVYPMQAPRNAQAPYIVYHVEAYEEDMTTCGPSGLVAYGIRLDCRAVHFDDLNMTAMQGVIARLRVGKDPTNVTVDSLSDVVDAEPGLYERSVDLTIWHNT